MLYNQLTERCFAKCVYSLQTRSLESDEAECVNSCSSKFIKFNNKLMQNFVVAQTEVVNKRNKEFEEQQRLAEQQNAAQVEDSIPQDNTTVQPV